VLRQIRKQTGRLAETWGIRNLASASQDVDTFSVLSLDLDKTFDFDTEISKLGPYLRAASAQRKQESEMQATANLIDDNLIDLTESSGQWTRELHEEFLLPRNGNSGAEDQGSENSEELCPSSDTEKEAPIGSPHLSPVPEDATLKEIGIATVAVADDKSFELYLDEPADPLHVPIDKQHDVNDQPRDTSGESSRRRSVALSSVELSQSSLPVFQLQNCHLKLPPEFQNRRRSSNSISSTETISLQWAAVQGYLDVAKPILRKSGASRGLATHQISAQVGEKLVAFDGWTALSLASYFGHLPVVEYFLQHPGSTIADQSQARNGSTLTGPPLLPPLYAAVASVPYLVILNGLTSSNSSPNVSANQDLLAITDLKFLRTQQPDLWRSQTSNSDEKMRLKIFSALSAFQHPAFSIDVQDRHKFNLIQAAACGTSLIMVKTILELRGKQKSSQKGFSLSKFKIGQRASDIFPDTPLHLAAFWNRTETVKLLLQRSTSPNISGYRNRTPIHYAAAMGNVEVIRILLDAKANVDVPDSGTHRPLDLAFQWGQWEAMTALIRAGSDLLRITFYNREHQMVTETILHTAVRVRTTSRIEAVRYAYSRRSSLHVFASITRY
jgi:ankyrin repeat protein